MLGSFYAKLAEVNKKLKKMVEVYVYTSDYARTGDYNILKICAHIRHQTCNIVYSFGTLTIIRKKNI